MKSFKKVFDPSGKEKLTFAADDIEGIEKWLNGSDYEHALRYAIKNDNDPVFGESYTFPCKIVEYEKEN